MKHLTAARATDRIEGRFTRDAPAHHAVMLSDRHDVMLTFERDVMMHCGTDATPAEHSITQPHFVLATPGRIVLTVEHSHHQPGTESSMNAFNHFTAQRLL